MRKGYIILLAAAVAAIIVAVALTRRAVLSNAAAQEDRLRAELRGLQAQLASKAETPKAAPAEPAPREPHAHAAPPQAPAESAAEAEAVARLRASLADANSAVARLDLRVQELETEVAKLRVDNQRLTASEADLNENLSSANRAIEAQRRELNAKSDRLAQLEAATQRLRDEATARNRRASEFGQLSAQLQEINRRRENFLSSIVRRYKEVNEQYRSMTAVLDSRRQVDASPEPIADVGRIQNAISQAEDDLRQLNSLTAQAVVLEKKLAAK